MRQLFSSRSHHFFRTCIYLVPAIAIFFGVLATFFKWTTWASEVDVTQLQPIPFSHRHHVGEIGIDCRYCHSTVEESSFAGMPPTEVCLTCHSQIWKGAPMLEPLRESLRSGTPVEWNEINRLPRFVYFNHSIHIQKGVRCSRCHGSVEQMPLLRKTQSMTMRECLSCHMEPEKYLGPRTEVFSLNPRRRSVEEQMQLGMQLLDEYHIHKSDLTDCKTCHR